jgi:uncharacterized membrane protein
MHTIEESIEVDAPIRNVYNQWTQFEEFPRFMDGVQQVRQLDDKRLHWVAEVAGRRREWDAEIHEQVPDERIAWRSTSGQPNEGTVRFEKLAENRTRIHVVIRYEPSGALEKMGDALGFASARVKGDLKRFKEFIESHGVETGAWRGEIRRGETNDEIGSVPRSKRLFGEQSGSVSASGTSDTGMGNE